MHLLTNGAACNLRPLWWARPPTLLRLQATADYANDSSDVADGNAGSDDGDMHGSLLASLDESLLAADDEFGQVRPVPNAAPALLDEAALCPCGHAVHAWDIYTS